MSSQRFIGQVIEEKEYLLSKRTHSWRRTWVYWWNIIAHSMSVGSSKPSLELQWISPRYHVQQWNFLYFFCFAPTSKIIFACINFPGSWHDAQVSLLLIKKVVQKIGEFEICVDQGFPRSGDHLKNTLGSISRWRLFSFYYSRQYNKKTQHLRITTSK